MKKTIQCIAAVALLALASLTYAAEKDKTVTGVATCGKDHVTMIKVESEGKTVSYALADNGVSKKFHEKVCGKSAKVKATGHTQAKDGKEQFVASKLELAE